MRCAPVRAALSQLFSPHVVTRVCFVCDSGKVAAAKRLEEVLKNMDSFVQLKTMGADLADNLSRFLSAET